MSYYIGRKGLVNATDSIGHPSVSNTLIAKRKNDLLPQKRTKRVEHQLTQEVGSTALSSSLIISYREWTNGALVLKWIEYWSI